MQKTACPTRSVRKLRQIAVLAQVLAQWMLGLGISSTSEAQVVVQNSAKIQRWRAYNSSGSDEA